MSCSNENSKQLVPETWWVYINSILSVYSSAQGFIILHIYFKADPALKFGGSLLTYYEEP